MTLSPITIQFFGAFKKYGDQETLMIPPNTTVTDFKNRLADHLSLKDSDFVVTQLIRDSALSCNDTIVNADYSIQAGDTLAILPPVCGG